MSASPEKHDAADAEVQMTLIAGSGETQNNNTTASCSEVVTICGHESSCCNDRYHRKLAIASIICGISCIGIKALIDSVKAETTHDQQVAARHLQKAKKYSIISIVTLAAILILAPSLMALLSYLLTLQD